MMDSFPDSVSDADIAQLLEPVALLDEKIEEQTGCRIVEVGEVIPVPDGAPQGWNEDEQPYRRTCPVLADEGQILGFTMDDENHGSPEAPGQANSSGGTFSYLRPVLELRPSRSPFRQGWAFNSLWQNSRGPVLPVGARPAMHPARTTPLRPPTGRTGVLRCVSVEIHQVFLPHAPRRTGASPPPGELADLGAHVSFTTGC